MNLVKSPNGLLELMRLRQQGQNPDQFDSRVAASIEATEFYGADLIAWVAENSAAGIMARQFDGAIAIFPRRYVAISGNIVVGAAPGTWLNLGVGIAQQGGTAIALGTLTVEAPKAGATYRVAGSMSTPLVMPPGYMATVFTSGDAAGADHVLQLRYGFQRLDGVN